MAESVTVTTLWLYRQLRAECDPQAALEAARTHVRIAKIYATADARWALVAKLSGEESNLTHWLQCVRIRAERPGRHGRYWETGKFQGELEFTLECTWANGGIARIVKCETAGCAIKHAFGWLREQPQSTVTISNNRRVPAVRVTAHTTMQSLLQTTWPAF